MASHEWVALVALLIGFLSSAYVLTVAIVRLSRSPDDGLARFTYGYLGVFGIAVGLASGLGLVNVLGPYVGSSWSAVAGVGAVNLLVQPVAVLLCWMAARTIVYGVRGLAGYAWSRTPESEWTGLSRCEHRGLSFYRLVQGITVLPLGVVLSIGCAWPLVQWALR